MQSKEKRTESITQTETTSESENLEQNSFKISPQSIHLKPLKTD